MAKLTTHLLMAGTVFFSFSFKAQAFEDGITSIGFGYESQNAYSSTSQKSNGANVGPAGVGAFPFQIKYDFALANIGNLFAKKGGAPAQGPGWFLSPQMSYTFFPRTDPGTSAKVSTFRFLLPLGKNFGSATSSSSFAGSGFGGFQFDWYVGPGWVQYDIKGSGGTTELNNGTTTSVFAVPGKNSYVGKMTTNFGVSLHTLSSRIAFDLMVENIASAKRRSQSFMVSYAFEFGGGPQ